MRRSALISGALAAALLLLPGVAAGEPGSFDAASLGVPGRDYAPGELLVGFGGGERLVELPAGVPVPAAAAALSANPAVTNVQPDYLAHAAAGAEGLIPNDPGTGNSPGGWQGTQWNFLPCGSACVTAAPGTAAPVPLPFESRGGIDAPRAWALLRARHRPGASGVKIAVLDTGVAFKTIRPRYFKSPDFSPGQFLPGHDFVAPDRLALDEDGHGTHVAGTIAEQTGNGRALTGLAYGAKLLPVRVLDAAGEGKAHEIGKGIRFAARRGAKVINMSFVFGAAVKTCRQIGPVCAAVKYARAKGSIVIAAAGNDSDPIVDYPARIPGVVGVGATSESGCAATYSDHGAGLDISAPGGKGEAGTPCVGTGQNRPIFQLTFVGPGRKFEFPDFYVGTSMSAPHVSGVAAMVVASGVLGANPSPDRIECQLELTARTTNLGQPYDSNLYGAGLLDAGAAVASPRC